MTDNEKLIERALRAVNDLALASHGANSRRDDAEFLRGHITQAIRPIRAALAVFEVEHVMRPLEPQGSTIMDGKRLDPKRPEPPFPGRANEAVAAMPCAHEWEPLIFLDASNVEGEACVKCETVRAPELQKPLGRLSDAQARAAAEAIRFRVDDAHWDDHAAWLDMARAALRAAGVVQ